jgi:hypothetical protein
VQLECRIDRVERCIRQSVLIVVKNVKFHLNPIPADPYIAEIVGQKEGSRDGVDIRFRRPLDLNRKVSAQFSRVFCLGH